MDWLEILWTFVLAVLAGISIWVIISRIEEKRKASEKLREERREIYDHVIDPFVHIAAGDVDKGTYTDNIFQTYEYRKDLFNLFLIGSDGVILAFIDLILHTYHGDKETIDNEKTMRLFGKLQLEIRKSLGFKKTKLKDYDMIKVMIKDL